VVHRDPETGKYVADSGDGSGFQHFQEYWYDDYLEQTLDIQGSASSNDLTGSTNDSFVTDSTFEPADGIDHGEVAELVAMRLFEHWAWVLPEGGSGTTPGRVVYDVMVADQGSAGREQFDNATEDSFNKNNAQRIGGPVIYQGRAVGQQAFNDTANGSGGQGGSIQFMGHSAYPYRDMFGVGPLFYPEDQIQADQSFITSQVNDENIEGRCRLQLVWDIHEVEDRRQALGRS